MAITVTINGTDYNVPVQGQNPPWGEDLTDVIVALAAGVNSVFGSADIPTTSISVANNQVAVANVTGASFDPTQVRSAIIQYSIYRSTTLAEKSECGHIYLTYYSVANTWELAQNHVGEADVTFTITAGGQLQYVSSLLAGASYTSKLVFSGKAFLQ